MRFLMSLLFIFFAVDQTAQIVPLIHTANVFWEYNDWGGIWEVKSRIYPAGDTVISDKVYTILKNENYRQEYPAKKVPPPNSELTNSYTYIRISEGKLYRKEMVNNDDYDKLIFNSAWQVGDTIEIYEYHKFQLVSIDTVNLGGIDRRRWTFINIDYPDSEFFTGIFIEGIGGLYGRLDRIPIGGRMLYDENDSHNLDCFTLNGKWIIGNNCELGTLAQPSRLDPKITIHVDKANDVLQIKSDFTFTSGALVKMYDINGRIVLTRMIHASTTQISYPAELTGIYMVEFRYARINFHQKILIR